MSVNISLIVLKKMYDILMIFVDFCWNFPWFWLIFCYPDPFHWSRSWSGWPKWNWSKRIRIRNTAYNWPLFEPSFYLDLDLVQRIRFVKKKTDPDSVKKKILSYWWFYCVSMVLGDFLSDVDPDWLYPDPQNLMNTDPDPGQ